MWSAWSQARAVPADSLESLKALAIVVRSFALHEAHGHADYDLCDSTHCQLLHWGGSGSESDWPLTPHAGNGGRDALVPRAARPRLLRQRLRWPHRLSRGDLAAGEAASLLPSQPDPLLRGRRRREWASEITRAELTAALAAHGLARPGWQNLTVARRGASGRAVTLRLDGVEISAEDFRLRSGRVAGMEPHSQHLV